MQITSRIQPLHGLVLLSCVAFLGCPDPVDPEEMINLTASGLVVVSAEPRVGYPLEVDTLIETDGPVENVSVSYYALNKSDADQELEDIRQFYLATVTFPSVEPSITEYRAEFTVPPGVDPPGDYVIQYIIDPAESLVETDKEDNTASADVRLAPIGNPNLFIEELTLDSTVLVLHNDFDDVERSGQEIEDVWNSNAGATLVIRLHGALDPVDVEATADLRITADDLPTGSNTHDVPMYLWDSVAERYVDAYGLIGDPEGLSVGTLLPQIVTEADDSVDFNATDRKSVHLDIYFPGRLAEEMERAIWEANLDDPIGGGPPTEPPPDLTPEAIAALRSFILGAGKSQLTFSIVAKVSARGDGFVDDDELDNEASNEVTVMFEGLGEKAPSDGLFLEEGMSKSFSNDDFGVSFEFNASASYDERGAIANVNGSVPVTVLGHEFDFMAFSARGQVVPAQLEGSENSGFALSLDFAGTSLYSDQGDLGFTLEAEVNPSVDLCPNDDNDADGVLNDVDGDGVIDPEDDACPDDPGYEIGINGADRNGCPGADGQAPVTLCPNGRTLDFSKEESTTKTIWVGPVPITVSASVAGAIGFEMYANIQPTSLAAKAGPFVNLSVTAEAAVGLLGFTGGIEGGLDPLIDERFNGNILAGLFPIPDGVEGKFRVYVANALTGPTGAVDLVATWRSIKWCKRFIWYPCGSKLNREEWELVDWVSFVRTGVLFDRGICKAMLIDNGVSFSACDGSDDGTLAQWVGVYDTGIRFGGASGVWNDSGELTVTETGAIFNNATLIVNPSVDGDTVSWARADGNAHDVEIVFATSQTSDYYWRDQGGSASGKLFTGTLQSTGEGALDFRGLARGP